ncbi:citrulline utilization hydrolase CtlX [Kineosphaera limosa]|nr:arginine deiminase-related protein [Kineosphaera limosa]
MVPAVVVADHRGNDERLGQPMLLEMTVGRCADTAAPCRHHAPNAVVMVRPHHFAPNPATRADNAYQSVPAGTPAQVARAAFDEVTAMADTLRTAGVTVHLFDDTGTATPDSVFPNNWFSTEASGSVAIYPMHCPNRRNERRQDILDELARHYRVTRHFDYSRYEHDGLFLEGTGSMVLDHHARRAYACRSRRMSEPLLHRFCADFDYEPVVFDAFDDSGVPIYHSNVLMSVGTSTALVGLDAMPEPTDRRRVRAELEATGRQVVPLSRAQIAEFAGNAFELSTPTGNVLVMSARGVASLSPAQRATIEAATPLLPVAIPTIEHAGGSARCMLAGIHLQPQL